MIYLIVGLDLTTLARWHGNVQATDASTAAQIARSRAAAQGIELEVAAAIGPYSTVIPIADGAAKPQRSNGAAPVPRPLRQVS